MTVNLDTTLIIDNYDSFTWNVYQYVRQLLSESAQVKVYRNDEISLQDAISINPNRIIISPGPGTPSDAKISNEIIKYFSGRIPILGICLGMQCMYEILGGTVKKAGEYVHGKTSSLIHDQKGIYENIPQDIQVTRYHSLAGDRLTLPSDLIVTSETSNGVIMGVRHKHFIVEGVQFHPESISTEYGRLMIANFLKWKGARWDSIEIINSHLEFDSLKVYEDGFKKADNKTKGTPISILDRIKAQRINDISIKQNTPGYSLSSLESRYRLGFAPSVLSLYNKLESSTNTNIVGEIKRASPSKGDINIKADSTELAIEFARAKCAAISVLTEPKWFKGSIQDMANVRKAIETIPDRPLVLCKDFIIDKYQILEARLNGADSVLLIVAIISTNDQLSSFIEYSRTLGMEPLVEAANEDEIKRAILCKSRIIGINNRDLHTFTVDMNRTISMSFFIPKDIILIALSGIKDRSDILKFEAANAKAYLVGESLMKSSDKRAFIETLQGISVQTNHLTKTPRIIRKICGITSLKDAQFAISHGADFIGFIFCESPRRISVETAKFIIQSIRQTLNSQKTPFDLTNKPRFVGVFLNSTVYQMNQIAKETGIDLIQLHGSESPTISKLLSLPTIKVIHVSNQYDELCNQIKTHRGVWDFILLDAAKVGNDGTGIPFSWELAKRACSEFGVQVFIAGGIKCDNLKSMVDSVGIENVLGVDIASGVEISKGIKNPELVELFLKIEL